MRDRLAAESPEGRDSRQQAVDTFEEREVRLQRATGCANREQSLFKQHFVQDIILQYHFYQLHMHHVMCILSCIISSIS